MTTRVLSPDKDPMLPPATNQLWVSNNWSNSLNSAPQFAYKLQNVSKDKVPVVTDLNYLNVSMTDAQWQKWPVDADDEEYILDAIAANLGLTRA